MNRSIINKSIINIQRSHSAGRRSRVWAAAAAAACLFLLLCACGKTGKPAETAAETAAGAGTAGAETAAEAGAAGTETAAGTGVAGTETAASGPVRVTDMTGHEIVLTEPVTRAVALTAADCEIIYALGAGDVLVGRGEYCDYPAEASGIPSVQSGYETNIEQILALSPQVVFLGDMDQPEEQLRRLEEAGVQTAVSDADDIEGVYTSIRTTGTLLGKDREAEALIESMQKTFAGIQAGAFPEGSTVYFEVSPLEWGLWTAGKGTFMNEAAELMGLENCFSDVDGWAQISEEQVLERDPDLIVTITMYAGEGATPEEEILSRPGWETVTAVRNRAVLNLQNNELSRPGPRLAEGTQMLYDFAAGHLDPQQDG